MVGFLFEAAEKNIENALTRYSAITKQLFALLIHLSLILSLLLLLSFFFFLLTAPGGVTSLQPVLNFDMQGEVILLRKPASLMSKISQSKNPLTWKLWQIYSE